MTPAVSVPKETLAVVMTERALLPELESIRKNAKTRPVWRSGDAADMESQCGSRDGLLEFEAVGHRLRLA